MSYPETSHAFRQCAAINREMASVIGALPGSSIWAALEACAEKMDEIAANKPSVGDQDEGTITLANYNTLDQLAHWLFDEEAKRGDARNKAWALHAAKQVSELTAACRTLVEQYQARDDYTLGGSLTNAPFLKIAEVLADAD